jgi:hypothetical protein
MMNRRSAIGALAGTLTAIALGTTACGSNATVTTKASSAAGAGPGGTSGGGPGAATKQYTATGAYTVQSGTVAKSGTSYSATAVNQSAVLVKGTGNLTLTNPKIAKSGDTKSSDESSFYGLNAGVLAEGSGKVIIKGGTVSTTGTGSNGVFAYGKGTAMLSDLMITATARYAHGAMASGGGEVTLTNVKIDTKGANSAPLATDRGGGTIVAKGGSFTSSGIDSPGVYSTDSITVSDATITATTAEGIVTEGHNKVVLNNCVVVGGKYGAMLYQSFSGDAGVGTASLTMTGGSMTSKANDAFYVQKTAATVTLKKVTVTSGTGILLRAANSGKAILNADRQKLTGDVVTDSTATATLVLKNGSTLTGKINKAALTLDSTSAWTVTSDSTVTALSGASISGSKVTNIVGNGKNVYYSKSANSALGGKTYTLSGGGRLIPQ